MAAAMVEVAEELERACEENPAFPALGLCFPDADVLTSAFLRADVNCTSDLFLGQLHRVVLQLLAWPSAWPGIQTLLAWDRPWTRAYCDTVLPHAQANFLAVSFRPVYPLLSCSLTQLRREFPQGATVLERWFASLQATGDAQTKLLLRKVRAQDAVNAAASVVQLGPLEQLLQHLLSNVAAHLLLDVGAGSAGVFAVLNKVDHAGRTALHLAAQQGNIPMVETLIRAKPPPERALYVSALDDDGYSAEDQARLGGFSVLAAKLREVGGPSHAPAAPVKLFGVAGAAGAVGGQAHGGWNKSGIEFIPQQWLWLKPLEQTCDVDCIQASQFDWEVFLRHYLRHRRPLLVRGGASPADPRYAREELLAVAGDRTVRAFDLPYADQLCGILQLLLLLRLLGLKQLLELLRHKHYVTRAEALEMTLREYTAFLEERVQGDPSKNLSYVFVVLPEDERPLGFATVLPRLLRNKVQLRTTQFAVGGVLMGSPMHHHVHAANSLIFGRKLWLFKPPAEQEFRKTVMYHDLMDSGGAPGVARCVQEAGDLLFVPSGWIHGALCLCDCVGVAHEFRPLEPEFDDCDTSDLEALLEGPP